jgi:hypothetical protein
MAALYMAWLYLLGFCQDIKWLQKLELDGRGGAIYVKKLVELRTTVILRNLFFSSRTVGSGNSETGGLN